MSVKITHTLVEIMLLGKYWAGVCLVDPVKKNPYYDTVAAHSISAAQEIVPNRIGKEVNMFALNWWARMAS